MDEKLVCSYFAAVTREPIHWKNFVIEPHPLRVARNIFFGFSCPAHCGACCTQVSTLNKDGSHLEYLPTEPRASASREEIVVMNGKSIPIWVELMHEDKPSLFPLLNGHSTCKHLTEDARCSIYTERSFGCDLPILMVNHYNVSKTCGVEHNVLLNRKFGRHHLYPRVDGGKGTMCELQSITPESTEDCRRRLRRWKEWMDYFQISSWLDEIISWAASDPLPTEDLRLGWNNINTTTFGRLV